MCDQPKVSLKCASWTCHSKTRTVNLLLDVEPGCKDCLWFRRKSISELSHWCCVIRLSGLCWHYSSSQRCWIGLRSGAGGGQFFIFFIAMTLGTGSASYWNVQTVPLGLHRNFCLKCHSIIFLNLNSAVCISIGPEKMFPPKQNP